MAQLTRPALRPPWLCTLSVREGSLGQTYICKGPGASCAPVHPFQGCPRSGNKTAGNGWSPERQTGLPVRLQRGPRSAGPPGDGVATLPEAQAIVRARQLHDWAHQGCEWPEVTSDASDSRGGDGRRVATCGGSVDHPGNWCTQQSQ